MALNFGVLGQVLAPAAAGYLRGQGSAEAEAYKRQREEEERQRQIRQDALRETLIRSQIAEQQFQNEHAQEVLDADLEGKRFQMFKDLPTLYPPAQLPGEPSYINPGDELDRENTRAQIEVRRAQAALDRRRAAEVGKKDAKGPEFQKALDAIAEETGGDLAAMHRKINEDPELYRLRANRTIKDYHVGAAASKARKRAAAEARAAATNARLNPEPGNVNASKVPPKFWKFPNETTEAWVARMHRLGVNSTTVLQYGKAQGIE